MFDRLLIRGRRPRPTRVRRGWDRTEAENGEPGGGGGSRRPKARGGRFVQGLPGEDNLIFGPSMLHLLLPALVFRRRGIGRPPTHG